MKRKTPRPPKIDHGQECVEWGRYLSCLHSEQREDQRGITRREVFRCSFTLIL